MKVLCVAEKNSVGKAVANILGDRFTTRNVTGIKTVKNYDFTFNFPGWGECDVVMTSVSGHLTDSQFVSEKAREFKGVHPGRLFTEAVTTEVKKKMKPIANNITNEARHAQKLLIWTDCDREGEYIGWEVVQEAIKKNPRIEIKRAMFSDLERSHILQAARGLQELDMNAVNAVAARMEIDYRTGYAFTRLQTLHIQKTIPGFNEGVISYGSCQFPTLGFIADRFKARENFVEETFWHITLKCKVERKHMNLTSKRGHIFDRVTAVALYARLVESGVLPKVTNVASRPTSKYKPLPLTTVELLKLGSKALRLPSNEILKSAEELYQASFISYPRTETDQFSDDVDLKALLAKQKGSAIWGDYAETLVDGDAYDVPRKGHHNDKAHPPIHPIAHTTNFKDEKQRKVYELITRHFLACCSKDAKGQLSTVEVDWHGEEFSANGLVVLETNFLDIYPYIKWTGSEQLPEVRVGQELAVHESLLAQGKTTPPKLLTEPELLTLMDMNGIGTDATMAEHIATIITRGYIFRSNADGVQPANARTRTDYLAPSNLGQALVEGYDSIGLDRSLTKPFIRRDLENQLGQVAQGLASKDTVVENSLISFKDMFDLTAQHIRKLERAIRQRVV